MISDFLRPVPKEIQNILKDSKEGFSPIDMEFFDGSSLPEIEKDAVVIIGVEEDRGESVNIGSAAAPNQIRKAFYKLQNPFWALNLVDLGNIKAGESLRDTYTALAQCMEECLKKQAIVVVLRGSHDLSYAQYLAYENLEQAVNMAAVDRKVDLEKLDTEIDADSFLSHVILRQPNYLFNYAHIGYQSYYVNPDVVNLMDKMNFDMLRVGLLKDKLSLVEPIFRDTDLLSFDMSAMRASEFNSSKLNGPNGFYADDICGLARYAGISDKLSSVGFYEYNPEMDKSGLGAELMGQMLWYFIDGVNARMQDYPFTNKKEYIKYTVSSEEQDLIFYKSPKSARWWIEVPFPQTMGSKYARHALIPCAYEDYQEALEGEVPERWWKAFYKLG